MAALSEEAGELVLEAVRASVKERLQTCRSVRSQTVYNVPVQLLSGRGG
jgi:hypothetical protein